MWTVDFIQSEHEIDKWQPQFDVFNYLPFHLQEVLANSSCKHLASFPNGSYHVTTLASRLEPFSGEMLTLMNYHTRCALYSRIGKIEQ